MSYPTIGGPFLQPGEKWDAATIERLLRSERDIQGIHIFLEDERPLEVVRHDGEKFIVDFVDEDGRNRVAFQTESFLELATWIAFMGRDFI